MKFQKYKEAVKRTLPDLGSENKNMVHMTLGCITELGEIADIFKRNLAYGKDVDITNLKEEVGDKLWYLTNILNILNININERHCFRSKLSLPEKVSDEMHLEKIIITISKITMDMSTERNVHTIEMYIGSIITGLCEICLLSNIDIEEVMFLNIEKLYVRFPEKFSQDLALKRNLEEERKVLNKETI